MEAEVNEYGGAHMVMTNVMKDVKTRYVNFDTRFSNDYTTTPVANYYIDFPERIQNVRSISTSHIELPLTYLNFSQHFGNNAFIITVTISETVSYTYDISILDSIYGEISPIITQINQQIGNTSITADTGIEIAYSLSMNGINTDISLSYTGPPLLSGDEIEVIINYAAKATTDPITNNPILTEDRNNITSKLGWFLGFRQPTYTYVFTDNSEKTSISESLFDINGPRYLFLAIDEFNNSAAQSSFVSMVPKSLINKNILARISIQNYISSFGSILIANEYNGLLASDKREYSDDIDLQKLRIQLLDEYGRNVNLNGMNFSFLLSMEHT